MVMQSGETKEDKQYNFVWFNKDFKEVQEKYNINITKESDRLVVEGTFKKEDIFYKGNQNGADVYEGFKDGYPNQPFKFSFKGSSVTIHVNTSFGSYYEGTLSASGN